MRRRIRFLREFVRHPQSTGAVTPSSRFLARRMLRDAAIAPGETVVEYGAGQGHITHRILEHLAPRPAGPPRRFMAVEINPQFAGALRDRFPGLPVHEGCASRVAEFLAREGHDGADVVISGLPWSVFPEPLQERILEATARALRPGGRFVTFAYLHGLPLPAGRRFRRRMEALLGPVETSPVVWRNVPPAVVHRCVRGTG